MSLGNSDSSGQGWDAHTKGNAYYHVKEACHSAQGWLVGSVPVPYSIHVHVHVQCMCMYTYS